MNDMYKKQVSLFQQVFLSRQHPRDLFDCKYMDISSFDEVKDGFMLCLLGSDKPIIESLQPNIIDQVDALENQFRGMSDVEFGYADYEAARLNLISLVNTSLTDVDKDFLVSFEDGSPDWGKCCAGDLSHFPSVMWKLHNIENLKKGNPQKHKWGVDRLIQTLF